MSENFANLPNGFVKKKTRNLISGGKKCFLKFARFSNFETKIKAKKKQQKSC